MGMSATNESLPVHTVKQKGQGRRSTHTNTHSDKHVPKYNEKGCKVCGKTHEPRKCPAWNRDCNRCGMKNPYAKCCDNFRKKVYSRYVSEIYKYTKVVSEAGLF